ncbi:MAG: hypothetical protein D6786_01385 [Gammaproteobacteria bacterium]|nr:MAG: hypothetical protein D6786_01385 [Gammaproteobacteria bacterium]
MNHEPETESTLMTRVLQLTLPVLLLTSCSLVDYESSSSTTTVPAESAAPAADPKVQMLEEKVKRLEQKIEDLEEQLRR